MDDSTAVEMSAEKRARQQLMVRVVLLQRTGDIEEAEAVTTEVFSKAYAKQNAEELHAYLPLCGLLRMRQFQPHILNLLRNSDRGLRWAAMDQVRRIFTRESWSEDLSRELEKIARQALDVEPAISGRGVATLLMLNHESACLLSKEALESWPANAAASVAEVICGLVLGGHLPATEARSAYHAILRERLTSCIHWDRAAIVEEVEDLLVRYLLCGDALLSPSEELAERTLYYLSLRSQTQLTLPARYGALLALGLVQQVRPSVSLPQSIRIRLASLPEDAFRFWGDRTS